MKTVAVARLVIVTAIALFSACGGAELDAVDSHVSASESINGADVSVQQPTAPDHNNVAGAQTQSLTPSHPELLRCKKSGSRCSNPFECCSLFCGFFDRCN